MKTNTKRKLEIAATVMLSVFIVSTAGVSTFAWFQASAASVIASGSSVEITVSAPDDDTVAATAVLKAYDYNTEYGYLDENNPTSASQFTTAVSSSTLRKFWPGRKMSFLITVTTAEATSLKLDLNSYTETLYNASGVSITNQRKILTYENSTFSDSGNTISILPALKMYVSVSSSSSFTEGTGKTPGSSVSWVQDNLDDKVTTFYIFYTLEFLDTDETYYVEYKKVGNDYVPLYTITSDDSSPRYFYHDPLGAGNSSCYERIAFNITGMTITASKTAQSGS